MGFGDKEWFFRRRSFFEYPEDVRSKVLPLFTLFQPLKHGVVIDEEVPLACYHGRCLLEQDTEDNIDPFEMARNSEVACVFTVRVRQKDHVPNGEY